METVKRSLSKRSLRLGAAANKPEDGELETDSLLSRKDDDWYESEFEEVTLGAERKLPQPLPTVRLKRPHGGISTSAPSSASQNGQKSQNAQRVATAVGVIPAQGAGDENYRNGDAASAKPRPVSSATAPTPAQNGGSVGSQHATGGHKANGEVGATMAGSQTMRAAAQTTRTDAQLTRSDSSLMSSLGIRSGHRFVTEIGAVEIENMEKLATNAAKEAASRETKEGSKKRSGREQEDSLRLQPFSYMPREVDLAGPGESSDDSEDGSDWDRDERGDGSGAAEFSLRMPDLSEVSLRGGVEDARRITIPPGLGPPMGRSQLALESGYDPDTREDNNNRGGDGDGYELEIDRGFGKQAKKDPKPRKTSRSGQLFTLVLVVLVLVMSFFYFRTYVGGSSSGSGVWETKELRGHTSMFEEALSKSLLFLEAQRSGKLPANNRVHWRGDSGLSDGKEIRRDLTGGYYDSGDSIKFNMPMAFTITMLSWGVVEYKHLFSTELGHARASIKWGADYLLKCWDKDNEILVVQVGDPALDHPCWLRPEDKTIPRTTMAINSTHPGSDVAGEMSAALAAASLALGKENEAHYNQLLSTAADLCEFAMKYKGFYSASIPSVRGFYNSTEYEDEVLWCNAWLYRATGKVQYLEHALDLTKTHQCYEFSWDSKHAGLHVLLSTLPESIMTTEIGSAKQKELDEYNTLAEDFTCYQMSGKNPSTTAGLSFVRTGDQLEYTAASCFVVLVYADYLKRKGKQLSLCSSDPDRAVRWVQYQSEYVLGNNPLNMSYMVGFGHKYPYHVHHRGASIAVPGTVNISKDAYTCHGGEYYWLNSTKPNPNIIVGAIVGGPSKDDEFQDARRNYAQSEPSTYTGGVFCSVFARLTGNIFSGKA